MAIGLGGDQPAAGVDGQAPGAAGLLLNHRGLFASPPSQHLFAGRVGEDEGAVDPHRTVGGREVRRDALDPAIVIEQPPQRRRDRRALRRRRHLRVSAENQKAQRANRQSPSTNRQFTLPL